MKKYLLGLSLLFLVSCGAASSLPIGSSSSSSSSVFVPTPRPIKEDVVDVYFIAGQSNAAGYSDFYRDDLKTLNLGEDYLHKASEYIEGYENILYYGKAVSGSDKGNVISELSPVKAGLGNTSGREIGAELGMAEYLAERYEGTNKKAIIIKHAMGASGLVVNSTASQEWSAPSYPNPNLGTQKNLFHLMCGTETSNYTDGTIYKGLNKAIEAGLYNFEFKGLFWAQGEAETDDTFTNYGEALAALIGDFRTYIGNMATYISETNTNVTFKNASKMPFLIAEVCATYNKSYTLSDNTSSREYINTIVSQEKEVAANDPNVETLETHMYNMMVNTKGYKSTILDKISYCADAYHYNADDMIDIGNRVAETLHTFTIDEGRCDHAFDNHTSEENGHTLYCSKCLDYKEVEHNYVTKYDNKNHYGECLCGHKSNVESHVPSVMASKTFEIGEALDKSLFLTSSDCACGYNFENVKPLEFTLSEEIASSNTKINYAYNGVNYETGIPLTDYHLEAETCNIVNDKSNYRITYEKYEIEEDVGQNNTASVGTKSMFGGSVTVDENNNPVYGNTKITISISSDFKRTLSLSMLAASTYNKKVGFNLEDACDLYYNGKLISFDDDAAFKGGTTDWFSWEEVHVKNFTLLPGENIIEIVVNYTPIVKQTSGQGPFNIDYFTFKYL